MPRWFAVGEVSRLFRAILISLTTATGQIAIFRHGASVGGLGVVALYPYDRAGFRAGWTQLFFHLDLFFLTALIFPEAIVA